MARFPHAKPNFSPILAAAMYLLPPLRLIDGARKVLYVCHGSK
jgi:hypothetical protein